jgi:hypothetical protein
MPRFIVPHRDSIVFTLSKIRTTLSTREHLDLNQLEGMCELPQKENDLTEQMATLRWVLDSKSEWDEAGLRDT